MFRILAQISQFLTIIFSVSHDKFSLVLLQMTVITDVKGQRLERLSTTVTSNGKRQVTKFPLYLSFTVHYFYA